MKMQVAAPAAVAGGAAGVLATLAWRDPSVPGHYPACPLLATTGLYCPGCGALRGLEALAEGDVVGMAGHNPLLVPGVAVLVWAWLAWTGRRTGCWRIRPLPASARLDWALLGVVLAFTLARNLPWGTPLGP